MEQPKRERQENIWLRSGFHKVGQRENRDKYVHPSIILRQLVKYSKGLCFDSFRETMRKTISILVGFFSSICSLKITEVERIKTRSVVLQMPYTVSIVNVRRTKRPSNTTHVQMCVHAVMVNNHNRLHLVRAKKRHTRPLLRLTSEQSRGTSPFWVVQVRWHLVEEPEHEHDAAGVDKTSDDKVKIVLQTITAFEITVGPRPASFHFQYYSGSFRTASCWPCFILLLYWSFEPVS